VSPALRRPALWLALLAAATTAGCAVWKVGTASRLVRHSEPFQASPAQPAASLLVVGDSTAVGTGASGPEHSVAGLLAQAMPRLRVVNLARDGARFADIVRQLEAAPGRFDYVLVLGGGNDVIRMTAPQQLRADVRRAAQLARERGEKVVLMPPGNLGNSPFFFPPVSWWMDRRSQGLHAAVREAADATGATYVRMYRESGSEADPFVRQPGELHAADGLHPSDEGYRVWMRELQRQAGWGARPSGVADARPSP
jgi:lysophospholipase L1-like esterase